MNASSEELDHQRALLRTHTRHLHAIEQQIAMFGPAFVPVHLLAQRDWYQAERARALRRLRRLEGRARRGDPATGGDDP